MLDGNGSSSGSSGDASKQFSTAQLANREYRVPGGPEPMTKGLGNSIPLTVTANEGPDVTFPSTSSIGSSSPPTLRTWLAQIRTLRARQTCLFAIPIRKDVVRARIVQVEENCLYALELRCSCRICNADNGVRLQDTCREESTDAVAVRHLLPPATSACGA